MKQTFLVEVVDQQNASWQGSVKWMNKGQKEHFRSALELIRLIDSALLDAKLADNEAEITDTSSS